MREDMGKVLVESPRFGRASARLLEGTRRHRRNRIDPDGEGGLVHIGMTRDGSKHFGEHLGPLFRYLRQQVNRPWAKVYGELCSQLDRRNVVQAHLFQHIDQQVERDTVWHDEAVWVRGWRGLRPLAESRAEMFVHPRTGMLLPNRARLHAAQRRNREREANRHALPADRRTALPGMAGDRQWHRVGGIWYEVTLRPLVLKDEKARVHDLLLQRAVGTRDHALLRATYGRADCHAVAKHQLGRQALRRHGLVSCAVEPAE
jgi:hypothetical protein